MADWANGLHKTTPGAKVYLFTGTAGNALDVLLARATDGVDHRYTLRPPLHPDDLRVTLGTPTETEALIVRDLQDASDADWALIEEHLHAAKVKGRSLVLLASHTSDAAKPVRARVSRQGVLVDVADPQGPTGRKDLVQWVGQEWQTTVAAATLACSRAAYSVETLVWSTRIFRALTSGRPVEGNRALRAVEIAVPLAPTEQAYRLLLARHPDAAAAAARLDPAHGLALLRMLEAALTDIELLYPVLNAGNSVKTAADRTGLHLVRALELAEYVTRYPPGVAQRCRRMLALGLANHDQPEAVSTVAILWS